MGEVSSLVRCVGGESYQLALLTAVDVAQREFMPCSLLRRYVCISVILGWGWHLMEHNCLRFRLDKPKMWNLFPITSTVPMVTGSLWVPGETDINNVASFRLFCDSYVCNRLRNIHLTHYSLKIWNLNQIVIYAWNWNILLAQQVWKTSICWISLQWIGLATIFLTLDVANTGDVTFLEIQWMKCAI